jgi:mono/diheme cytochrome c family protein
MNRLQHNTTLPRPTPAGRRRRTRKLAATAALLLAAAVLAGGCRREQMGDGSYSKPFKPTDFFADHNSTRPLVEGTIARAGDGSGPSDAYEYDRSPMSTSAVLAAAGPQANADFPADFPRQGEALRRRLERGQERFNIYCSVCHGRTGAADGMIVQRGFVRPPAFYPVARDANDADLTRREQNLLRVPPGYFFDKITNGYGAMYSYAARVTPEDRWNIAAYVRVLQASQTAQMADLSPADQQAVMKMSEIGQLREPGGLGGAPGAKPAELAHPPAAPAASQGTTKPAPEGHH